MPIFTFPDDAAWNEAEDAVEFGIELGEYRGRVLLHRRAVQQLLGSVPAADEILQYFHLHRAEFERVAEEKVRRRELDQDANIRITSRDLAHYRRHH